MNLSLIEAIKCGLPVISSNCSGKSHRDLISHNSNGYLFNQYSNKEFLKYLTILINSEKKENNLDFIQLKCQKKNLKINLFLNNGVKF